MPDSATPTAPAECTYEGCGDVAEKETTVKEHDSHSLAHEQPHQHDGDWVDGEHAAPHRDATGYACQMCDEAFKSKGGLKLHVQRNHPSYQTLACPACRDLFASAYLFILHLEEGACSVISPSQFRLHIVHTRLVAELLHNRAALQDFLRKQVGSQALLDGEEEGGVSLVDYFLDDGDIGSVLFPALTPHVPGTAATTSEFTVLPASQASTTDTAMPPTAPHPPQGPDARQPSPAATLASEGLALFRSRFWFPLDKAYCPDRFRQPVFGRYYCPFVCEQTLPTEIELSTHILQDHMIVRSNCPTCYKHFRTVAGAVAHCEDPGHRCRIHKASDLDAKLTSMSGGFVGVCGKRSRGLQLKVTVPLDYTGPRHMG